MNHLSAIALFCLLAVAASLNTEPGNENNAKNIFEEECFERGRCTDSPLETLQNVATPKYCWSECRNNRECNTYTHFAEAQECILFNSCGEVLETCEDCIHGRITCVPLEGHRVVTFGEGYEDSTSVQVYSLDSEKPLCQLAKLPKAAPEKPFGAFINGNLTVCGGDLERCFYLDSNSNKWEESFELQRDFSSAITTFDNDVWTFIGGRFGEQKDTFSVWRQGQDTFETFDGPLEFEDGFCSTRFNGTHALLSKGSAEVYWYQDQESLFERHEPPSGGKKRRHSACGLDKSGNEIQFVIAGGWGGGCLESTEIFSLEGQLWTEGPELPYCRLGSALVQFQNSFALLGGRTDVDAEDTGFFYNFFEGWIELPMKLTERTAYLGAISTYDTEIPC